MPDSAKKRAFTLSANLMFFALTLRTLLELEGLTPGCT